MNIARISEVNRNMAYSRIPIQFRLAIFLGLLVLCQVAFSFPAFLTQLKDSNNYPNWTRECQACHDTTQGGGAPNVYGLDYTVNNSFSDVALDDSDCDAMGLCDGIPNEVELLFNKLPGDASDFPPPPSGVSASDATFTDKVTITWNSYTRADFYEVYRSETSGVAGQKLGETTSNTIDDLNTILEKLYYYTVNACVNYTTIVGDGCTDLSIEDEGLRTAAIPPASVSATDGLFTNLVTIIWDIIPAATSYEVYRSDTMGGTKTQLGSPAAATFDDDSAVAGTTYFYFIKTCVGGFCTDFSLSDTGFSDSTANETKLIASDGASGDRFGFAVGISANTSIVGAWTVQHSGIENAGSAYIFEGAQERAKLIASMPESGDYFGYSVDIQGSTAVVGAFGDNTGASMFSSEGSAFVFTTVDGMTWNLQQQLFANDPVGADWFGYSIAIDGDTIVVGAYQADGKVINSVSGAAYVFRRNGVTWTQESKLGGDDSVGYDRFGCSVDISGDSVVVGAWRDDDAGTSSGSAYVFVRSNTSWAQQGKLTASDAAGSDAFGETVAIDGDTVVVGATGNDEGGSGSGSAYVFLRTDSNWAEQQKLMASDASVSDSFGSSVAILGDEVLVGATGVDIGMLKSAGAVYRFTRNMTTWTEQEKLTAGVPADGDGFGGSVASDPDIFVVGSESGNGMVANSGAANRFGAVSNRLSIIKVGSGAAVVTSSPAGIDCGADCFEDYDLGMVVTLNVALSQGSVFSGWSGMDDCTDGVVTMNDSLTCTLTLGGVLFKDDFEGDDEVVQ